MRTGPYKNFCLKEKKQKKVKFKKRREYSRLVGAGGLDVAGLLALVADALAVGFGCAVTRNVADLAAWIN